MLKKVLYCFYNLLKKIAKKNKNIDYFYRCYQLKNNSFFVSCAKYPNNLMLLENKISNNKSNNIMHIKYKRTSNSMGFCGILRHLLDSLFICERLNFKPFIEILDENNKNLFDEIFIQPSSNADIENAYCFLTTNALNLGPITRSFFELYKINPTNHCYNNSNLKYLKELAFLWKKYFHFKNNIQNKLQNDFSSLIAQPDKMLAVHYRGSDFNAGFEGHPKVIPVSDYFKYIDECLNNGFDKVFLATDDANALKVFIERYSNHIVYFKDTFRTTNNFGIHMQKNIRDNNKFLIIYEVLRDIYSIARC
ncbi:MAG: hypothetical protein J6Z11_05125, partial [Candidatus Riflebacteria bacterium]|nr:hypothetical protein [Candidatus Riflebacteria bacterium]